MAHHECAECRHLKTVEDEHGRSWHICCYSQSPCFLEETGICGNCDIDDDTEEWNGGFEDE